ncbi:hypothetical protein DFH07DRAFT_231828 [Mycena maculata]|uniref:Uncharacterized protein n=1 Tax=Mycena maculata TaxID=230809 RepID=A0AAD7HU91_9AGAR|nr:hypothetical protein DFH07DRAFT_231828 [Mycena maculata]
MHDTASMVAWSEPFIGVSFNYRIGALGFLPSKLSRILNLGLKDQVNGMGPREYRQVRRRSKPSDSIRALRRGTFDRPPCQGLERKATSFPSGYRRVRGADLARAVHSYDAPIHETQFRESWARRAARISPAPPRSSASAPGPRRPSPTRRLPFLTSIIHPCVGPSNPSSIERVFLSGRSTLGRPRSRIRSQL